MEKIEFRLSGHKVPESFNPILVGVVGSGNLEVMIERQTAIDNCCVNIITSAQGFSPIWAAVLQDFQDRHSLSGVVISINDMGATPAVVSLRLDQAANEIPKNAKVST